MARMIEEYASVCLNVEPVNEKAALRWQDWRKGVIGKQGKLKIYESDTQPGKFFLIFSGIQINDVEEWDLQTSSGSITVKDNILTLESHNSRYVFELKEKLGMWMTLDERKD